VPFVSAGEVSLFYTDDGTGDPPLLFVHGYSCDSHDWSWQLPHFVDRHRVIAVDNRGHGRSSVPDSGYDYLDFATDLANLLEQLGCSPVVAIGHSLGGVIASALAVERPQLVRGVVSIDPSYLIPDDVSAGLGPLIDALESADPVAFAQSMLGGTYTAASSSALRTWQMRRIAGMPVHVLTQTMRNLLRNMAPASRSAPYLSRRCCPVLALYADPARGVAETALFDDPRSRVVTFEGSGHWLHQERPVEVNHLIDTWLRELGD